MPSDCGSDVEEKFCSFIETGLRLCDLCSRGSRRLGVGKATDLRIGAGPLRLAWERLSVFAYELAKSPSALMRHYESSIA